MSLRMCTYFKRLCSYYRVLIIVSERNICFTYSLCSRLIAMVNKIFRKRTNPQAQKVNKPLSGTEMEPKCKVVIVWSYRPAGLWLQKQAVAAGNWLWQDTLEPKIPLPGWLFDAKGWGKACPLRRRAEDSWCPLLPGSASKGQLVFEPWLLCICSSS